MEKIVQILTGNDVAEFKKKLNMTQVEFADFVNISQGHLSKVLRSGEKRLSKKNADYFTMKYQTAVGGK
jgi:DNA-binding transcriptional regulator YiaG